MKSIDSETANVLAESVAQNTAARHLGVLQQYLTTNAADPENKKTHDLIRQQMGLMGTLDPSVQKYIPWDSLNQQFLPGRSNTSTASPIDMTGVSGVSELQDVIAKRKAEEQKSKESLALALHKQLQQEELQRLHGEAYSNPFMRFLSKLGSGVADAQSFGSY
jgi:hypothetical protein